MLFIYAVTLSFLISHYCMILKNLILDINRIISANADNEGALVTCKIIIQMMETRFVYFKITLTLEMKTQC